MGQGIQERTKKICGRQPLKNLKWYGLPNVHESAAVIL